MTAPVALALTSWPPEPGRLVPLHRRCRLGPGRKRVHGLGRARGGAAGPWLLCRSCRQCRSRAHRQLPAAWRGESVRLVHHRPSTLAAWRESACRRVHDRGALTTSWRRVAGRAAVAFVACGQPGPARQVLEEKSGPGTSGSRRLPNAAGPGITGVGSGRGLRRRPAAVRADGRGLPGARPGGGTAGDLVTASPVTIGPDAPLAAAARLMGRHQAGCFRFPALTGERLGVVSHRDLQSVFLRPDGEIAGEVRSRLTSLLRTDPDQVGACPRRNRGPGR